MTITIRTQKTARPKALTAQTENEARRNILLCRWLILCCTLVCAMILIGAITRLTESGLSIVQWKLVTGAIPPLTEAQWQAEFEEYKASPEFLKKNFWMTVSDFKHIYFWEWLHRLLGRLIGMIYLLPFLFFLSRSMIPKGWVLRLSGLILLVGVQGFMGWYMVKSGLVDQPAVSHYRLAAHLGLALLLYALTLASALALGYPQKSGNIPNDGTLYNAGWVALGLLTVTILWGAFTAGLDAGLVYNETFPMMGKDWVPPEITNAPSLLEALTETHVGVQFLHRWLAVATAFCIMAYALYAIIGQKKTEKIFAALFVTILLQVALGIGTLFSGTHILPATMHQAGAVLILTIFTIILYRTRPHRKQKPHD